MRWISRILLVLLLFVTTSVNKEEVDNSYQQLHYKSYNIEKRLNEGKELADSIVLKIDSTILISPPEKHEKLKRIKYLLQQIKK